MWKTPIFLFSLILFVTFVKPVTNFRLDPFTKCYGKYGCYSLKYPWYSSHRVVNLFPKSDTEIDVNFYLYTRENRRKRQEIFEEDVDSVRNSHFDAKK